MKAERNFVEKVLVPVEAGVKERLSDLGRATGANMTQVARTLLMKALEEAEEQTTPTPA